MNNQPMTLTNQMLSIQEAAFLSRKSTQTIRRLIKSNKIRYRRRKTPQGFNYFIEKDSLLGYLDLAPRVLPEEPMEEIINENSDIHSENNQSEPLSPIQNQGENDKPSVFSAKINPAAKMDDENISSPNKDNLKTVENIQPTEIKEKNTSTALTKTLTNQNLDFLLSLQTKQLEKFADTISTLIVHHNKDKEQFLKIIGTYQERINELEDKLLMLSAPKKKWYEFWK